MTDTTPIRAPKEAELSVEGRALCQALYAATKLVALYGPESQVVSEAMVTLTQVLRKGRDPAGNVKLRVASSTMFLNGNRVKMDLDGFLSFQYVSDMMAHRDIGEIWFHADAEEADVLRFLTAIHAVTRETENVMDCLLEQMTAMNVRGIELVRRKALGDDQDDAVVEDLRESSIQMYFKACFIARALLPALAGTDAPVRKGKRVVHNLVDILDRDESLLVGMTGIKAFDDFHGTHAANVAILSICMGRRVGMPKRALAELGVAALFHDAGRTFGDNAPAHSDEQHAQVGARRLLRVMGFAEGSLRTIMAARNHHGAACNVDNEPASMVSRIIAVADFFDTLTTPAGPDAPPVPAQEVLEVMTRHPRRFDPRLAKVLASIVGAYPLGTVVRLDTGERAVVCGSSPETPLRPLVRVLDDADGNAVEDGAQLDLSTMDPETDTFAHSVNEARSPAEAFETAAELVAQL